MEFDHDGSALRGEAVEVLPIGVSAEVILPQPVNLAKSRLDISG